MREPDKGLIKYIRRLSTNAYVHNLEFKTTLKEGFIPKPIIYHIAPLLLTCIVRRFPDEWNIPDTTDGSGVKVIMYRNQMRYLAQTYRFSVLWSSN